MFSNKTLLVQGSFNILVDEKSRATISARQPGVPPLKEFPMSDFDLFILGGIVLLVIVFVWVALTGRAKKVTLAPAQPNGDHGGHLINTCDFIPGHGYWWLFGRVGLPALLALALVYTGVMSDSWVLIVCGIVPAVMIALYFSLILADVQENTYVALARANQMLGPVRGEGFHEWWADDEPYEISLKPMVVKVLVKRRLKDGATGKVGFEVTMSPEPRLANERGKNLLASWKFDGLQEAEPQQDAHKHHVEDAIGKTLNGLVGDGISHLTSKELSEMQHGLALFVESEIALAVPLHRAYGIPEDQVVAWYHKNQRMVRRELDRRAGEFDANPAHRINPASIGPIEAHVGGIFMMAEVVSLSFDKVSTAAATSVYVAGKTAEAAAPLMASVGKFVADLVVHKTDPNAALTAAMALLNKGDITGNIFAGGGGLANAGALGTAVGGSMSKNKKGKH